LLKGIEKMKFNIGDMVVLTDESKKYYSNNKYDIYDKFTIYIISEVKGRSLFYYGYPLNEQQLKSKILIAKYDYRLATESEIKTFKLKNLFVE
jgi:hypothetical protein